MFKNLLTKLRSKKLLRTFRTIDSANDHSVQFSGKDVVMMASNNYFGLNVHPEVVEASCAAVKKYGVGNVASRLVVNLSIQNELEKALAAYKKKEACLVFSSGYAANVGVVSSVVGEGAIILSDELNHASIVDGCKLSKAVTCVYNHCDVAHLELLLKEHAGKKILVVTDSIFSMDGDRAPLEAIINLKKKYGFVLMVDDAHATGIIDTSFPDIDICVGTLSKTLGSQGGYVCGSRNLIDFFSNSSRSFMYSTGLNPGACGGALAALLVLEREKDLRNRLLENVVYLKAGLSKIGLRVEGGYQILTLSTESNEKTMRCQEILEREGVFVTGIRKPSVASPRLRITAMATHTRDELDTAIRAFEKIVVVLAQ
ncbi:MAG: pyridoxal phosphate-dependent aminotransferase family protein [Nanoarchaeota archaeon]|nr:pyridoxal phosphate-dependent aminotransferase family protein [Nanoarchaeota archaeon]